MKYHPFFSKIKKDVAKNVVYCSRDWCFKAEINYDAQGKLTIDVPRPLSNNLWIILYQMVDA